MLREVGSRSAFGAAHELTISGTKDEIDALRSMLLGCCWLRVEEDGKTTKHERFAKLPDPVDDPAIPQRWHLDWCSNDPSPQAFTVGPDLPPDAWHSPSFFVRHLCGYFWSRDSYSSQVRRLQSWGFELLRSRRGDDGRYKEVWVLDGVIFAQGDLKAAAEKEDWRSKPWQEQCDKVRSFLCQHASFGSFEVTVQRAAMTID